MSRIGILFVTTVLLLAGCTPVAPDPELEPEPEETATPVKIGDLTDGPVQDTWVYERIQTVSEAGFLDITEDVVSGLDTLEEGTELPGGVTFYPLTSPAYITDLSGNEREDLDVTAGVARSDDLARLQVIATPREDTSVNADDVVILDLSFLDLPGGSPLIATYAFGQGLPADGEDLTADGVELLADRMSGDRFQWFAVEDGPDLVPGLLTALGMLPSSGGGARSSSFDGEGVTNDAMYWEDRAVVNVFDGGGGGIPLKAQPTVGTIGELAMCTDSALKCLSEYFKNMKKGSQKSLNLLFEKNMSGPPPYQPPGCPPPCGGGTGEPHMTTFDQHTYDLQLVGEFVFATSEDFTVQMRTAPAGSSDRVSMITGVAVEASGEKFTLEAGRDDLLWHNGEGVPDRPLVLEAGGIEVHEHGGVLQIFGSDGVRLIVTRLGAANFDVWLDPGSVSEWSGLLGSADGDVENDLTSRDGDVVAPGSDVDELYGVFGESWRISDSESLFDYAPGENTATYTDLDFPREHVTLSDLDPTAVSIGKALCEFVGITDRTQLEWCIFDYAATGDISFVTAALFASVNFSAQGAAEWVTYIPEASSPFFDAVFDDDGRVLITTSELDSYVQQLTALDVDTGAVEWTVPLGKNLCVAISGEGEIFAKYTDGMDREMMSILDPADGSVIEEDQVSVTACDHAVTVGDVMVFQSGEDLHLYTALDESRISGIGGLIGAPVVSQEGRLWAVATPDGEGWVYEIDPVTGEANGSQTAVVPFANPVGTAVGLAAGYGGDDEGIFHYRTADSDPASGMQFTPFPILLDGEEWDQTPKRRMASDGDYLATYLGGQRVLVLDAHTGEPLQVIAPSSFENNGAQVAVAGGLVAVGPFGGDAWVEMYDAASGELAWEFTPDSDVEGTGYHDVKRLTSAPGGQVIAQTSAGEGVLVALVGSGG